MGKITYPSTFGVFESGIQDVSVMSRDVAEGRLTPQ